MITEDNDNVSFLSDAKFLDENTKREKDHFGSEIMSIGDELINEINLKKIHDDQVKQQLIKKILKKEKKYKISELNDFSIADIRAIYEEIKSRKNKLTTLIHFIFNLG